MHDHSRRLVHHEQLVVLEHDRERDVLTLDGSLGRIGHFDDYFGAVLSLEARFLSFAIDQHRAIRDKRGRL